MSKWQPNEEEYRVASDALPGQSLQISSDRPLRCSRGDCRRDITNDRPYLILHSGQGGAVLWHLSCIGISAAGEFNDPKYLQHVAGRILSALRS